eukprot:c25452_g1_i1 orf=1-543(-)
MDDLKDRNPAVSLGQKPNFDSLLHATEEVRLSEILDSQGTATENGTLSNRWREIQGENNWVGLLDPLDLELRKNIIRYGEFNQAAYDSFDNEEHSKYSGSCKYSKLELFEKVGLTRGRDWGYRISRYLYATSMDNTAAGLLLKSLSREAWPRESNWIGYVAVATDNGKSWLGRRDIVIVWR